MKIKGNWETRQVWIDGEYLDPAKSQKVHNHSPDGHNWSYSGSGPAQLALSILLHYLPKQIAMSWYQDFKQDVIAGLPPGDFQMEMDFAEWLEKQKIKKLLE